MDNIGVPSSNEYLLAKIGVGTAENEPLEVWGENSIQYSLHSLIEGRKSYPYSITRERVSKAETLVQNADFLGFQIGELQMDMGDRQIEEVEGPSLEQLAIEADMFMP